MIEVHAVAAFSDNYIWLIQAQHSNRVLIVDPGIATPVLAALRQLELEPVAILVTHHHADHVGGIVDLLHHYSIPVYGPANEIIPAMSHPLSKDSVVHIHPDFPEATVLKTPGHTANHICWLIENNLFCGDTLFAGGCGRLLGGTATELFTSLQRLGQLPTDTRVFCAHEYTQSNLRFALAIEPDNLELQRRAARVEQHRLHNAATVPSLIQDEQLTNPFLRCHQPQVKKAVEQHFNRPLHDSLAVFTALRQWKDNF